MSRKWKRKSKRKWSRKWNRKKKRKSAGNESGKSQQHYGWVSVSDKDGRWDVWLIFAKMGNEPEMDRTFSGNGQMKGKMRLLTRKWTGNDSGHGGGN